MDIVIPYSQSRWGNTELRYAIRSACRHLLPLQLNNWPGNIFIIGDDPGLQNVIHVPMKDGSDKAFYKERNIFDKVLAACNDSRVSDDFIFMNDDHFLLPGFDVTKWYGAFWNKGRTDLYGQTITNTLAVANSLLNFDIHCPCVFNKTCFKEIPGALDWKIKAGYCMKTVYHWHWINNYANFTDLKISDEALTSLQIKRLLEGRVFFSTADRMRTQSMLKVFDELYPIKSIYEN